MLWRESYQTKIAKDLPLPNVHIQNLRGGDRRSTSEVWVGGFGFLAAADQGVWWRLLQNAYPNDDDIYRVFIAPKWSTKKRIEAMAVVPPSEHVSTLLITDPENQWEYLVDTPKSDRGFAAIVELDRVALIMVGPPTEEAWDQFQTSWNEIRN